MPMPPEYDLLIDPANTVFAVNCRVEDSTLHCGALYLEPAIPFKLTRLAYNEAIVDVHLPEELLNQPTPTRAWNIALPITNEQIQPAV